MNITRPIFLTLVLSLPGVGCTDLGDLDSPETDPGVPSFDGPAQDSETVTPEPSCLQAALQSSMDMSPMLDARGVTPAVAASDTGYLMVWSEISGGETDADIFGALVNDCGDAVAMTQPFAISASPERQSWVRVASNGSMYLVVWIDERDGAPALYGARISSTGQMLDLGGLLIDAGMANTQYPDVASNGADFVVVYEGGCVGGCVHGVWARSIGADGTVGTAERISNPTSYSYSPSIAAGSDQYVVVWGDARTGNHDVYARFLAPDAAPNGDEIAVSDASGNEIAPRIAANATGFYTLWQDTRDGTVDIYGTDISASGEVGAMSGELLAGAVRWQDRPSLAAAPDGSVTAFWSANVPQKATVAIYTADVNAMSAIQMISESPLLAGSPQGSNRRVASALRGSTALYMWQERVAGVWQIFAELRPRN